MLVLRSSIFIFPLFLPFFFFCLTRHATEGIFLFCFTYCEDKQVAKAPQGYAGLWAAEKEKKGGGNVCVCVFGCV